MMRFIFHFISFFAAVAATTTYLSLSGLCIFQLEGLSCSFCGKFHTSLKLRTNEITERFNDQI